MWFKGAIPRHAFHFWVTHLDTLPTRSRLAMWGLPVQHSYCLCDHAVEDRDHLFLRCEVSEDLWSLVLRRLGYRSFWFHTWRAFISWLQSKDSVTTTTLRRLAGKQPFTSSGLSAITGYTTTSLSSPLHRWPCLKNLTDLSRTRSLLGEIEEHSRACCVCGWLMSNSVFSSVPNQISTMFLPFFAIVFVCKL